jgi:hypothetical protein
MLSQANISRGIIDDLRTLLNEVIAIVEEFGVEEVLPGTGNGELGT